MATGDAVELAPDAQDEERTDDGGGRVESVRERIPDVRGRLPRPGRPSAQDAIYVYVTLLLFAAPAVAVVGATWVALSTFSLPVAVGVGGVSGTVYALFLTALIVRYEQATTVEESK
jgi:hypothetical protein